MSFNDIFKSSFLENVTEFSLLDTLIGLVFALVVGLFIFLIACCTNANGKSNRINKGNDIAYAFALLPVLPYAEYKSST